MKILNKEVKLPSKKKEIHCQDSKSYWPTSKIEDVLFFPFLNIMYHTSDKIKTQITLLTSSFKMFKMHTWYDNKNLEENVVDNIGIRCNNCVKTTGLYVKN